MDQYKRKQLKFEDYLFFFEDHRADKVTYNQLDQEDAMNAVPSLDLVMPTRSTITSSIYSPMLPLSLVEVQLNICEMQWKECPIGSVMSYCAASDNSSSVSTVASELTGICTKEKKIKKEKIHDTKAGLVAEPLPVKKTVPLPVGRVKEHDAYSWRKNCTKKRENIACSLYYGCRTTSFPTRKTVVTGPNDSSMCIITYTGEHNHRIP